MWKRICKLLLMVMAMLALSVWPVFAAEENPDNSNVKLAYVILEDGTAEISESTNYLGIKGELIIPDSIDGHMVTSIGTYAFENCSGLTEIELPSGLTSIGSGAFYI